MATDVFLIATSIATVALLGVLIALLVSLHRNINASVSMLRSIHHEVMPLVGDMRDISFDLKEVAQELRLGMVRVNKLTQALGAVGEDIEAGREAVKEGLGSVWNRLAPFASKFKLFGGSLTGGEVDYE